jgi:hypothetical protein
MSRSNACRGSAPTRQSGDQVLDMPSRLCSRGPGGRTRRSVCSWVRPIRRRPCLRLPELPLAEGGSQRRLPRNRVTAGHVQREVVNRAGGLGTLQQGGWGSGDLERRWANDADRDVIVSMTRLVEAEPSLLGLSAHLLAIARKANDAHQPGVQGHGIPPRSADVLGRSTSRPFRRAWLQFGAATDRVPPAMQPRTSQGSHHWMMS